MSVKKSVMKGDSRPDFLINRRLAKSKRSDSRPDFLINRRLAKSKPQNYKKIILEPRNLTISRRSQVTIFVILAIVIIAILLIAFNAKLRDGIKNIITPASPLVKLQDCLEGDLRSAVQEISKRGGSLNPINYYAYQGEKIEYLCFTNQYYQTCSIQQPLLRLHMERELLNILQPKVKECMAKMKADLRDKGYNVQEGDEKVAIDIALDKIVVVVSGVSVTKGDTGQIFNKFNVDQKSNLYSLIMITTSILNFEARYGDSESTTYMFYYPGVKVQKLKQTDGSKVYILSQGEDKFTFATRSLSWPGGYYDGELFTPNRI